MSLDAFVVSDLDNTLLNSQHELDPLTIATFQELEQCGIPLAIASGRHYTDIQQVRTLLGVSAYIISSNGAHLYDPDDRLIFEQLLSPDLVKALTSIPLPDEVRLNLYTADQWLIDRADERLLAFHQSTGFRYKIVPDIVGCAYEQVGKVLYIGEPEILAGIEAQIREQLAGQVYITYALPDSLEVMSLGVNKGHALGMLLDRLNISPEHCVAFGDNLNDIEMLELAGGACVMENANPLLFEALPAAKVIGDHDEAGVARELRQRFRLDAAVGK